jgi:hypothetical protein
MTGLVPVIHAGRPRYAVVDAQRPFVEAVVSVCEERHDDGT